MASSRFGHTSLIAAVLVAVVLAVACLGLAPAVSHLSTGAAPLGAHLDAHALGEPALAVSVRTGSGGIVAALAFGGFAWAQAVRVVRSSGAASRAPLGWHKLAAGLVPLPLRI